LKKINLQEGRKEKSSLHGYARRKNHKNGQDGRKRGGETGTGEPLLKKKTQNMHILVSKKKNVCELNCVMKFHRGPVLGGNLTLSL